MKRRLIIAVLVLTTIPVYAVPGWLIGFGVGVTVQVIPWTRNHIIMPPLLATKHAIQRTVRPMPQDKIDKAHRKAQKAKEKRNAKFQTRQAGTQVQS